MSRLGQKLPCETWVTNGLNRSLSGHIERFGKRKIGARKAAERTYMRWPPD